MDDLEIHFLDVGQGDGIFIKCPGGEKILIDFGSLKSKYIAGNDAISFLLGDEQDQGNLEKLDLLVLTHGHQDHYNLIPDLLDKFKDKTNGNNLDITRVWHGGDKRRYTTKRGNLLDILENDCNAVIEHIPYSTIAYSKKREFGDVIFHVLSSSRYYITQDVNDDSIVLQLEYQGIKVMLCGDASRDIEKEIIESCKKQRKTNLLPSQIMKIGHHGSDTASSNIWLDTVKPSYDVIFSDTARYRIPRNATTINLTRRKQKLASDDYYADHNYTSYNSIGNEWNVISTSSALFTSIIGADGNGNIQGAHHTFWIDALGNIIVGRTPDFGDDTIWQHPIPV